MNDRLIKIGELAERLQVSTITIRNWMESGRIPRSSYIAVAGGNRTTYRFDYDKVFSHLSGDNADRPEQLEMDL